MLTLDTDPPKNIAPMRHSFLFVDDEDYVLRSFERDFDFDADLTLVKSPKEAFQKLAKKTYSVIISDLRMPGTSGITFLEQVKKKYPNTVRILITGKGDFDSAVEAINKVDLFSFIEKPWNSTVLNEIFTKAIEHLNILLENKRLTSEYSSKCSQLGFLTVNLEDEVQKRTTSMLLGMVNALDLRDTETHWHSKRVALFSHHLAIHLNLPENMLLEIERGALLHDVGKIGVSDTILLKPAKLTDEEWQEMRRHAEYGYRILEHIEFLGDARKLVWQHHERFDGKGYPRGLKGSDIYVGARIFAIIDTYDAITSDRPYRKARSHEVACEEIEKMSGTQFDPEIVDVWKRIPKYEILKLREDTLKPDAGLR